MKQYLLSVDEILAGYDAVSPLYPYTPSLCLWRAWEYAAYRRYSLPEPLLDIGCGDGRFFRLVWPHHQAVTGVDIDAGTVETAQRSGVYQAVHQAPAHQMPFPPASFASAFANCALEHMDNLTGVLNNISHSLRPGSPFLLSVVTDKFLKWTTLPLLLETVGEPDQAQKLQTEYEHYHHLVNPLPVEAWIDQLDQAGFEIVEYIPIVPETTSRFFLFLDQLWQVRHLGVEQRQTLQPYLAQLSNFPQGFRHILKGILSMEQDWVTSSGLVFQVQKRTTSSSPTLTAIQPQVISSAPALAETATSNQTARCWCGNIDLLPFSPNYQLCPACQTLVTISGLEGDITHIVDDERDFYGRNYWFDHQELDLAQPNLVVRARADLPERCLHWLRALLKYKLPPARVLELGSAHGGFVAMLRQAGYEATGLELSPWIVNFAQETFQVPMLQGPIEEQQLEPGSLDVIVMMDVLEHLADPVQTVRRCLELLKPDGLLLIQTPCFPEGGNYEQMKAQNDHFLKQLKAEQHLYLFSRQSVKQLFQGLNTGYVSFEPAIFDIYDMFLVASRVPLASHSPGEIEQALAASTGGRLVQALLDLEDKKNKIQHAWATSEADRKARQEVITRLKAQLETKEADRVARGKVIQDLKAQLETSEADRAARLRVIQALKAQLETAKIQNR